MTRGLLALADAVPVTVGLDSQGEIVGKSARSIIPRKDYVWEIRALFMVPQFLPARTSDVLAVQEELPVWKSCRANRFGHVPKRNIFEVWDDNFDRLIALGTVEVKFYNRQAGRLMEQYSDDPWALSKTVNK